MNKLLKSVGGTSINRKNRDEVLVALNCYGKMIKSSNKSNIKNKNISNNLDAMKKLNKHPRLFKKAALALKKLIEYRVNTIKTKKIKLVIKFITKLERKMH